MAGKTSGVGFNTEQMESLIAALEGVARATTELTDKLTVVSDAVKSGEAFGDSEQTDAMINATVSLDGAVKVLVEKTGKMSKTVKDVAEVAGVAAKKNISSVREAADSLAATKRKIEEGK